MKRLLVLAACIGSAGLAAAQTVPPLQQELRRVLDRELAGAVDGLNGVLGYAAMDLTSGEEMGRLDRLEFPTASTIKLAVLYELFRQADEGRLRLDEALPLDRTHVVGGTGVLRALDTPVLSLRDHAVLMISLSDNTATNLLIDRVTLAAVGARMQGLGLPAVRLRRRMMDAAAAARGDENVATPRDMARLLRALHAGEGLSPEARAGVLTILEIGAGGYLRDGIPASVEVLNKPGELEGVRADAAIVRAPHRPYAVVVMTTYLKDEAEGERTIAAVSRAFYEYFSRLGAGSPSGRQMRRP